MPGIHKKLSSMQRNKKKNAIYNEKKKGQPMKTNPDKIQLTLKKF